MKNVTKYFGFVTVAIEWIGFIICAAIATPYWEEPLSQFGYYSSTQHIFRAMFTLVPIAYYLYMRHMDSYWKHASSFALVSATAFFLMGIIPYEPLVRSFIPDAHNLALVIAIIFFAIPIGFIGFKRAHHTIALYSRILFYLLLIVSFASLFTRYYNIGLIYVQAGTVFLGQTWLVITNILLLQHHKEIAAGHTGKL